MSAASRVRGKAHSRKFAAFVLALLLSACNASDSGSNTPSSTSAESGPEDVAPVTTGSKSENFLLYQDVVAMAGGSTESQSNKVTATLGQSSPTGDSRSENYVLVGGASPE